jgi:hypothetical protein
VFSYVHSCMQMQVFKTLSYSLGLYYSDHWVKPVLVPCSSLSGTGLYKSIIRSAYLKDHIFFYMKREVVNL